MNKPILDQRTKEELMAQLKRRAKEYTPEWRYEQGDSSDPGAAIATLFGELFYQTIDRFNLIPDKYYTEFLNLLGTPSPSVTPASGLVRFATVSESPVAVPQGTELFAPSPDGSGEDIVFTTERKIEAVSANLRAVYYADAAQDWIERLDMSREQPFFGPAGGENLQRHRFACAQNEVLAFGSHCEIELALHQNEGLPEEDIAKLLADPSRAVWRYFDGEDYPAFDRVEEQDGLIRLFKETEGVLQPDEDGKRYLYCDVGPAVRDNIRLSGISIRSSLPAPIEADGLFHNDVPIERQAGGYCFGRRPMPYELFYIRSDSVFCKRGANAHLTLDIRPVVYDTAAGEPQYEFNRRIIDKKDAVRVVPDDVFVEQVVWEYYNGTGWTALRVTGNENPFSCRGQEVQQMTFPVPDDIEPVVVNAEEGYFIRARVIHVENYMSTIPRWILPFVKGVTCDFHYPQWKSAQAVRVWENAEEGGIEDTAGISDLALTVYEPMPPHPRAVYLCFDRSFHAMPLSILFEVAGETLLESKILFEVYDGEQFRPVRVIDGTDNLRYTGMVLLYLPEALPNSRLFGEEGCWLRMSLSSMKKEDGRIPHITGIDLNIIGAQQQQKGEVQFFSTEAYEAGKRIELLEKPVLSSEIWVDESQQIQQAQIDELEREHPEDLQIEREDGLMSRCWVRWKPVGNLLLAGAESRVYALDSWTGVVRFGNGTNGKVPPKGELNIRAAYTYGGGVRGNLPQGAVNALVGSIPGITEVHNIVAMSGGTDRPAMRKIEALGNKRIRHRERALGVRDFEEMTLSRFERAAHAKCFSNVNQQGEPAPGHVCLVVMGRDFTEERMRYALCREIYDYLAPRADCNLVASGRLHVIPSLEITVNVEAWVEMEDLDIAAVTQQEISENISRLIDHTWRMREIGNQMDLSELYRTIKANRNVRLVQRVLCEGSYYSSGRRCLCALDGKTQFPFATVRSGRHMIRIG